MGFRIWNHHDLDRVNEIRAERAIGDAVRKPMLAIFALLCMVGCFYTAGPVDKTAPFVFYIIRVMFGENTCIVFLIGAAIFALMSFISGTHISSYDSSIGRSR